MNIYYADTTEGYDAWLALWQRSVEREPFAHPGYVSLYAGKAARACAASMDSEEGTVLYPFLLRDLHRESFWPETTIDRPAYDIVTPYGYGGPEWIPDKKIEAQRLSEAKTQTEGSDLCLKADRSEVPNGGEGYPARNVRDSVFGVFYRAFSDWAAATGVVSEFVRFSLFTGAHKAYYGMVEHNNDNIVAGPELQADVLWEGFRHKVRKNVRTAEKRGLQVLEDVAGVRLDEFREVYHDTLKRRRAAPFYYFSRNYYEGLLSTLGNSCRFFHVMQGKRMVASELVLCSTSRVYSFLGGTLKDSFSDRASDLLKYHIMRWAGQEAYQEFVIGGGYRPHDGIFAFKKGFAPNGIMPFYIGKMIFDKERYQMLATGKPHGDSDFFPLYRRC